MANGDVQHPLVIGQQQGLGPLSPAGKEVWHGNATPCVSCGQLIQRSQGQCPNCGQDHSDDLLAKMARLSGPWFVYDHEHPFPGISVDRLLKLIERGQLVRTSIVRGPTTCYQWRFATETPLVARHLGYCWKCQHRVDEHARSCLACKTPLNGRSAPRAEAAAEPPEDEPLTAELQELSRVVASATGPGQTTAPRPRPVRDDAIGRGPLIFLAGAVIVFIIGVLIYSST